MKGNVGRPGPPGPNGPPGEGIQGPKVNVAIALHPGRSVFNRMTEQNTVLLYLENGTYMRG